MLHDDSLALLVAPDYVCASKLTLNGHDLHGVART